MKESEETAHILSILSRQHTIPVLVVLTEQATRYGELLRACHINGKQLSRILHCLMKEKLIIRELDYSSTPPQVHYRLTRTGAMLMDWPSELNLIIYDCE